jgi:hypothetical protein
MTFPDTPDARREIDRLDPNDPVLLDSDRNRVHGDLCDLARIMIRSIERLTPEEKEAVRDALDQEMGYGGRRYEEFTIEDIGFLRSVGSNV